MYVPTTRLASLVSMRALLAMVMMLGVLSMQAGRGTLAYFTSTAASTANAFTTGTLSLKLTDANETAQAAISASIGSAAFKPGDTTVGYVTVNNGGTLPFDYGLKYTATNTTGTLWVAGATNPTLQVYTTASAANCTQANVVGAKTGLTSAYAAASVSTTADTTVFDSGAASKRPVAVGAGEVLCLAVNWPNGAAGAESAQMGATGNIDFNFDAR